MTVSILAQRTCPSVPDLSHKMRTLFAMKGTALDQVSDVNQRSNAAAWQQHGAKVDSLR